MGPQSRTRLSDFHLDTTPEEDVYISHFIGGHIEALKPAQCHKTGSPCYFLFFFLKREIIYVFVSC